MRQHQIETCDNIKIKTGDDIKLEHATSTNRISGDS